MSDTQREPPETSDAEIVRRMRAREPDGVRILLERHAPRIRSQLKSEFRSLPPGEADSALNLGAHRAWRSIGSFDPQRGTLRAWFYVIVRNCAIETLRRDLRQRRLFHEFDWQSLLNCAEQDVGESDSTNGVEFIAALQRCVAELPRLQRAIIEADLVSADVAEAAELAVRLGTTTNSIYVSRSNARAALRRSLIARGFDSRGPESDEIEPPEVS